MFSIAQKGGAMAKRCHICVDTNLFPTVTTGPLREKSRKTLGFVVFWWKLSQKEGGTMACEPH